MILRRSLAIAVKLIVSFGLIGVLVQAVGVGKAFDRLLNADPKWLALASIIALLQVVICTLRWRAVLDGLEAYLRFTTAFKYWYIGAFFNQALPSGAGGDVVRGYLAYKNGMALSAVLSSLFLDRAATVLALVVLVAVMTPFAAADLENSRWFVRVVWMVLLGSLLGLGLVMVFDKTPQSWVKFRIIKALHHLAVDARRVMLHPFTASSLMGWSVLGHINLVLVVYVLFKSVDAEVSLVNCMLLFPPVLLAQVVPISIAGWGVREGAMVAVFALVGVGAEVALAVSILYGLVMILVSLPGALLWLGKDVHVVTKDVERFADTSKQ
ncbi:MAG: flippase-like domain-containing protein [Magnetovibrio sp.]|nr:flippase-like domain-containing protein [Magnetovibrio sp.]